MKVLVNAVAAKVGGAANYIRTLGRELAQAAGSDEFVFVVPSGTSGQLRALSPRFKVLEVTFEGQPGWKRLLFDQFGLRRFIAREKPDVLFSTANLGLLSSPVPQLLLVRNSVYFSRVYRERIFPKKSVGIRRAERIRGFLTRLSARAADVVMTPSQAMMDELRESVKLPASRTLVNHYGVALERFRGISRKPNPLPASARLLFTGLYSEHKNLGTLFQALRLLHERGIRCRLRTPADPAWEQLPNAIRDADAAIAAELQRDGLLEFTGVLGEDAVTALYGEADVFVYPSVVESFGHPLVEAMAAGIPVVAADVPINREMCGDAAAYFAPFDADQCAARIAEVIHEEALRRDLVERGNRRAEEYRSSLHAQKLMEALRELAQ